MDSRIWQAILGSLVMYLGYSIIYHFLFDTPIGLFDYLSRFIISFPIVTALLYLYLRQRAGKVVPDPAINMSGSKLVLIIGIIFVVFGLFMLLSTIALAATLTSSIYAALLFLVIGFVLVIASKRMKRRSR